MDEDMKKSFGTCEHPNCNNPLDSEKKRFCSETCKNDFHRLARIKGEQAMNQRRIKAALLENSKRLQRVAKFLGDGKPHSTREIIRACDVCAVSTIVDELREPKNGFDIVCKQINRDRWEYTMTGGFDQLRRIEKI